MNLIVLLVLIGAGYVIYSILDSYRSMSRELREIRFKCNMSANNLIDPVDTIKFQVLKSLSKLKDMAE